MQTQTNLNNYFKPLFPNGMMMITNEFGTDEDGAMGLTRLCFDISVFNQLINGIFDNMMRAIGEAGKSQSI